MLFLLLSCFSPRSLPSPLFLRYVIVLFLLSKVLSLKFCPMRHGIKGWRRLQMSCSSTAKSTSADPSSSNSYCSGSRWFSSAGALRKGAQQWFFPKGSCPRVASRCRKREGRSGVAKLLLRRWNDTLWLLAWAPHLIEIDPMPQKVPLDGSFSIRMEAT